MSEIPQDRRYGRTHEWARQLADGSVEVGISDHAQHALGDMVYVELPEVGRELAAGEACAVVESVKAASDVYSPVAGRVIAVNAQLAAAPQLVNQQPYGEGWLLRLEPRAPLARADLLDAAGYAAVAAEE